MTCLIPKELEERLAARALERQTTVDQIVSEAISSFLARTEARSAEEHQADRLRTYRELQQALALTPQKAAEWKAAIQDGRR